MTKKRSRLRHALSLGEPRDLAAGNGILSRRIFLEGALVSGAASAGVSTALAEPLAVQSWMKAPGAGFTGYVSYSLRFIGFPLVSQPAVCRRRFSTIVAREHPTIGVKIGNIGDIRAQPHLGAGIVRIDLEWPEQLAQGELLLVSYRLLGEDQDAEAVEGRFDLGKNFGCQCPGQVDPADFGAEGRVKRSYLYRHVYCPEKARYRNMSGDWKTINSGLDVYPRDQRDCRLAD